MDGSFVALLADLSNGFHQHIATQERFSLTALTKGHDRPFDPVNVLQRDFGDLFGRGRFNDSFLGSLARTGRLE